MMRDKPDFFFTIGAGIIITFIVGALGALGFVSLLILRGSLGDSVLAAIIGVICLIVLFWVIVYLIRLVRHDLKGRRERKLNAPSGSFTPLGFSSFTQWYEAEEKLRALEQKMQYEAVLASHVDGPKKKPSRGVRVKPSIPPPPRDRG